MPSSFQPPSHTRSLLRHIAAGLNQQMIYWGFDVQQDDNLLIRHGMEKIPRPASHKEGSSRYRMSWKDGTLELHGFCAGWYSRIPATEGVIYIRSRGRIISCQGDQPQNPGFYDNTRLGKAAPDYLLQAVRPLIFWWIHYENWIRENTRPSYRARCWEISRQTLKSKRWLRPEEALEWLKSFVNNPATTLRPTL